MLRTAARAVASAVLCLIVSSCSPPAARERDLPEPVQTARRPWPVAAGMLGLAAFSARVLVISRQEYPLAESDTLSAVSPVDLAVAWGPAARAEARKAVQIRQAGRRYEWRARTSDMLLPGVHDFTMHSGNWHMIPATPEVARDLTRIERGDVVAVEGDLVQVTFTNGTYYGSSLRRDDVGDGACEIVRVTSIAFVGK